MRRLLESRVRRKELLPVQVEGAGTSLHWIRPDALDAIPAPAQEQVHILSPFDPLIIQRKRLRLFFDYEYRFEAYVPKQKRLFGYFVCPVLIGDRIVAGLDLKTDRQRQNFWCSAGTGSAERPAHIGSRWKPLCTGSSDFSCVDDRGAASDRTHSAGRGQGLPARPTYGFRPRPGVRVNREASVIT